MKLIAIILLYLANWIMPCDHQYITDKWYVPKHAKGFYGYSIREHCVNCGRVRYPLSKNNKE